MEAPDSFTVTLNNDSQPFCLSKSRTTASVSREAVPLPMAIAFT